MKRLTLLTILLVVVGLTAGAIEVKPAVALTGTGTLEWGIDLDNMDTGFKNSATGDLVVTLMTKDGTDTHAGKDGWYGSITIANIELYWTDGVQTAGVADANVTAKIVGLGGALAIGVVPAAVTGPDLALDFVGAIENADVDDTVVDIETDLGVDPNGAGTYVSYTMSDAFMFGFEVVSSNDWTVVSDSYAMAFDVQAKFAPLTINAGVNYGFNAFANTLGVGVKAAADTAMVDGWVGFDGSLAGTTFAWEVGAGATVTFMETVTAALSVVYGDLFNDLDVKVVFTEPAAKGLVDNLDATLTVYLLDVVGSSLEYEVILAGGYKMGILYPHFSVTYGDAANPVDNPAILGLTVGVTADVFPLTQLALHYTSADLLGGADMGTIVAGVTVTY